MGRTVAFLCFLLLFAAGCLERGPDGLRDDDADRIMAGYVDVDDPMPGAPEDLEACLADAQRRAAGECHDHRDPDLHRFASQARLLDHLGLRDLSWSDEVVVGVHTVDVHGDLLAVGVRSMFPDQGRDGFHLIDVSDPERMEHLSFWDAGMPVRGDRSIAFGPDGDTVFLGFEGSGVRPGVAAVDVSDPGDPREVHFWDDPQDYGSHTVSTARIGGDTYVFVLALGVNILRYDPADGFTLVGKYVTADDVALLELVGMLDPTSTDTPWLTYAIRSLYGHDMAFYHDPVTGKDLLLVAYAYQGMKIIDLTVPSAPLLQARWTPPSDTGHRHYTHSVTAERDHQGRLVVVVGSETFEPENQHIPSPIWLLDATDAVAGLPLQSQPEHLSTWTNPGGAAAGDLLNSVHFFRQQDGFLYLSHYHGGVWAFDLRTDADRRDVHHFAYIMPVPPDPMPVPEECCLGFDLAGVPMVFDVAVDGRGYVYAADLVQGITSIRVEHPGGGPPHLL